MIDAVSSRKKNGICFLSVGIGNLTNFAEVKSLCKFGACLLDNNAFFF